MFRNLNHKLQKFSYTRLDDDETMLRPIFVKLGIDTTFSLLVKFAENLKKDSFKIDDIHHEIWVKQGNIEITFCLANDEHLLTIISVNIYSNKRGLTFNRLINILDDLKNHFSSYLQNSN